MMELVVARFTKFHSSYLKYLLVYGVSYLSKIGIIHLNIHICIDQVLHPSKVMR